MLLLRLGGYFQFKFLFWSKNKTERDAQEMNRQGGSLGRVSVRTNLRGANVFTLFSLESAED